MCVCDCVCANRWLGCTAGISPSLDRGSFTGCDIVVEAVIEDLALKKPLYEDIGRLVWRRRVRSAMAFTREKRDGIPPPEMLTSEPARTRQASARREQNARGSRRQSSGVRRVLG